MGRHLGAALGALISVLAIVIVQGSFGAYVALGGRLSEGEPSVDFATYFVAARAEADGLDAYTLTDAEWSRIARESGIVAVAPPYRYPPLTLGLVTWLAKFPFRAALVVWTVTSVVATGAATFSLSRAFTGRWVDPLVVGAVAIYVPGLATLYTGQINDLVLLGVALYVLAVAAQRPILGGIALAVGAVLKPLAAPLALLAVWQRDRQTIAGLAIGVGAAAAASLVLAGPRAGVDYLARAWTLSTLELASPPVTHPTDQSLFAVSGRLLTAHPFGSSLADDPTLARNVALVAAAILVVSVGVLAWPRRGARRERAFLEIGLVLVTIDLAIPVAWYHHEVLAIVALLAAWHASASASTRAWLALAFGRICAQGVLWHRLVGQTPLLSLAAYGLLVTYVVIASQLWRGAPRVSSTG